MPSLILPSTLSAESSFQSPVSRKYKFKLIREKGCENALFLRKFRLFSKTRPLLVVDERKFRDTIPSLRLRQPPHFVERDLKTLWRKLRLGTAARGGRRRQISENAAEMKNRPIYERGCWTGGCFPGNTAGMLDDGMRDEGKGMSQYNKPVR